MWKKKQEMKRLSKAANANFQCLITEYFSQIQFNQRNHLKNIEIFPGKKKENEN